MLTLGLAIPFLHKRSEELVGMRSMRPSSVTYSPVRVVASTRDLVVRNLEWREGTRVGRSRSPKKTKERKKEWTSRWFPMGIEIMEWCSDNWSEMPISLTGNQQKHARVIIKQKVPAIEKRRQTRPRNTIILVLQMISEEELMILSWWLRNEVVRIFSAALHRHSERSTRNCLDVQRSNSLPYMMQAWLHRVGLISIFYFSEYNNKISMWSLYEMVHIEL